MSHHVCSLCNKEVTEHTLEEAQTCYYQNKLPLKEVE